MELILVARCAGRSHRVVVRLPHVLAASAVVLTLGVTMAYATQQADRAAKAPRAAAATPVPEAPRADAGVVESVAALERRLAELDRRGERLLRMAGYEPDDWIAAPAGESPRTTRAPRDETLPAVSRLRAALDDRRLAYAALESIFTLDDVRRRLLPTLMPLEPALLVSEFGWRPDPFTGEAAHHEGVDFVGAPGATIRAAGGGRVVYSDFHPQYGNMLALDHGDGIITRYAHADRRLAEVGDVVSRGATIGVVGSSGRSTGVHLHFEVRRRGVPLDPAQFLRLRG